MIEVLGEVRPASAGLNTHDLGTDCEAGLTRLFLMVGTVGRRIALAA